MIMRQADIDVRKTDGQGGGQGRKREKEEEKKVESEDEGEEGSRPLSGASVVWLVKRRNARLTENGWKQQADKPLGKM